MDFVSGHVQEDHLNESLTTYLVPFGVSGHRI